MLRAVAQVPPASAEVPRTRALVPDSCALQPIPAVVDIGINKFTCVWVPVGVPVSY